MRSAVSLMSPDLDLHSHLSPHARHCCTLLMTTNAVNQRHEDVTVAQRVPQREHKH